jgi:ribonucleotide monophosphatase NagD (HAD superfamily)
MVYERLAALLGRPVERSRVLAIGDGLPTDIRGAQMEGIPALFVTAGIHAHELGPVDNPDPALVDAILRRGGVSAVAHLPHLVW